MSRDGLKCAIGGMCTRRLFLFEESIVVTKPSQKETGEMIFVYLYSINTSDIVGLTECIGNNQLKFEIIYQKSKGRSLSETLVLQAPSLDVKNSWIHDITRISTKVDNFLFSNGDVSLSIPCRHSGVPRHMGYFNGNFV